MSIVKNENMFGDNGTVIAYTFTRKATESNMTTAKQLSYKNQATEDDSQEDFRNVSTDQIIDFAFYALTIQDEDGSWNILFVFDTKTNQVLMVKIGYSGTKLLE